MVLLVVFGAGVATGRALFEGVSDPAEATATEPTGEGIGSQRNPIAYRQAADVGPWSVRVDGVAFDAADRVLAANQFNPGPAEGLQFVLVDLSVRREVPPAGPVRGSIVAQLAVPSGTRFPLAQGCGVLPRPLDVQQQVAPGAGLEGQWCWAVPVAEVGKLSLLLTTPAGEPQWFALR
ncbi:hypothetical protein BH23ACT9_BH23ACT9_06690 [soil metagenome]